MKDRAGHDDGATNVNYECEWTKIFVVGSENK